MLHILSLCLDGGGEEAELGASSHRLLRVRGLGPGVRLTGQHSIGYNFHLKGTVRLDWIFMRVEPLDKHKKQHQPL